MFVDLETGTVINGPVVLIPTDQTFSTEGLPDNEVIARASKVGEALTVLGNWLNPVKPDMLREDWVDNPDLNQARRNALATLPDKALQAALDDAINMDSWLALLDATRESATQELLDTELGYFPCTQCGAFGSNEDHELDNDEGACLSCQDIYGNTKKEIQ